MILLSCYYSKAFCSGKHKSELNSREECTELRDLLVRTAWSFLLISIVIAHSHRHLQLVPSLHFQIICATYTAFQLYHTQLNILFTFPNDAVELGFKTISSSMPHVIIYRNLNCVVLIKMVAQVFVAGVKWTWLVRDELREWRDLSWPGTKMLFLCLLVIIINNK